MAAQYFPVQTIKNLNAHIEMRAAPLGEPLPGGRGAWCAPTPTRTARTSALAFRIEDGDQVLVYASDAGYGPEGPSAEALALYADADLLIHDATFTPEDRASRAGPRASPPRTTRSRPPCARGARRLALFHYDQDYSDRDVDQMLERGRHDLEQPARPAGAAGRRRGPDHQI